MHRRISLLQLPAVKIWLSYRIVIVALVFSGLSGIAAAQNNGCSNATLQGSYALTLHGEHLAMQLGGSARTGAGTSPTFFASPVMIDGVAIVNFDGVGNLTQADFVIVNGLERPGQTDSTTGFDTGESGIYTVFSDCTGSFEVDFPPTVSPVHNGSFFAARFAIANQGADIHAVVENFHAAAGTSIDTLTCNTRTGCTVLTQTRIDGARF